jgi:membrane protein
MSGWLRRVTSLFATAFDLLRVTTRSFGQHRARRLGAGLAYYSLFALVPTLFLALAVVAAIFGTEATEGRLVERLDGIVGVDSAKQIEEAVGALWENSNTSGFAIITLGVVVYSSSILFVAWRDSLEALWGLPFRSGLQTTIRSRVYGALVPIGIGLVLVVLVFVEILTGLAHDLVTSPLVDAAIGALGAISPSVASVLALGLLYRISTRLRPRWGDIWAGTLTAAAALAVLAWGYGLYVRTFGSSSAAGAASSVLLGLVFVYYCAQVLLFGAELISTCADHRGRPLHTTAGQTEDRTQAGPGMPDSR